VTYVVSTFLLNWICHMCSRQLWHLVAKYYKLSNSNQNIWSCYYVTVIPNYKLEKTCLAGEDLLSVRVSRIEYCPSIVLPLFGNEMTEFNVKYVFIYNIYYENNTQRFLFCFVLFFVFAPRMETFICILNLILHVLKSSRFTNLQTHSLPQRYV
jgi:hypothetical protein